MGNLWCTTADTQKVPNVTAQGSRQSSLEKHLVPEKKVSECFTAVSLPLWMFYCSLFALCLCSLVVGGLAGCEDDGLGSRGFWVWVNIDYNLFPAPISGAGGLSV